MTDKIRVLVTCAGSGIAQSVIDSLRHAKEDFFIVTSDQARYRYSVPDCDGFVDLPKIAAPEYTSYVRDICQEMQIDVLIPGHDQELALFSKDRAAFEDVGTQVIVSGLSLVELLRNKLNWARKFREQTDVVVQSMSVSELHKQDDVTFPLIAKPSGGSASTGLHILHSMADAESLPEDLVVQSFLYPPHDDPDYKAVSEAVQQGHVLQISEISVQLLYSRSGKLMGRFASKNRLKDGVPVEVVPIDDASVWDAVKQIESILTAFEPRGPINLQGRMTDRGLVFFEMNPRFTGITGNRAQFGFNEVEAACRNFTHNAKPKLLTNTSKIGVRQVACRTWSKDQFAFSATPKKVTNIVILGGTSWLGRAFIDLCKSTQKQIVVISRVETFDAAQKMFQADPSVDVISSDDPSCANYLGWADALINLASARPPSGSSAILESYAFQSAWLTKAAIAQTPVILNISSQSVYKQSTDSWSEEAPLDISTPYAFSKYATEEHLRRLKDIYPELTSLSLRIGRLFGPSPGLRLGEFPHMCITRALNGEELKVTSPQTVIDLLDIRDAASAMSHFLSVAHLHDAKVYNIGSDRGTKISDFVQRVHDRSQIKQYPGLRISTDHSEATQSHTGGHMNCAKAQDAGWTPSYDLDETIDALIDDLSAQ